MKYILIVDNYSTRSINRVTALNAAKKERRAAYFYHVASIVSVFGLLSVAMVVAVG
ncbi:MAG: hypothetical protein WBC93_08430 [Sulfitobacter sp.]